MSYHAGSGRRSTGIASGEPDPGKTSFPEAPPLLISFDEQPTPALTIADFPEALPAGAQSVDIFNDSWGYGEFSTTTSRRPPSSGAGAINGTGNALGNVIAGNESANSTFGYAGSDTITGGAGDDMLWGGIGGAPQALERDVFVLAPGSGDDIIADSSAADAIELDAFDFASFGAVQGNVQVQAADLLIDLGAGDTLRLLGMASYQLQASNFVI